MDIRSFQIQKGIRQGCHLCALLFLLVVEILAANIRKNANEGLNITLKGDEKTIHISQLADDTTLFLKNKEAIIKALQTVEKFGKCSALKLNKGK